MSVKKVINPVSSDPGENAAVVLVRSRIEALYEEYEMEHGHTPENETLTDKFWKQFSSHPEPHVAWADYYKSLSEADKEKLWQEYHLKAGQMSGVPQEPAPAVESPGAEPLTIDRPINKSSRKRARLTRKDKDSDSAFRHFLRKHVAPIVSAALVVSLVWLVFNNELVVARVKQFVSPGSSDLTPTIIDPSVKVTEESRVIIPKINVDVPVVYDVDSYDEKSIQAGLESGVVHYWQTAKPGQSSNNVIVGHSSNNFFNGGKYKFAFVLLNRLEEGDSFILNYKGTRYVYRVFKKVVIQPDDFTYIQPTDNPIATLITCDPPGTSWRRLVIQGEQISPDPSTSKEIDEKPIDTEGEIVPGNSESLWGRFWNAIF